MAIFSIRMSNVKYADYRYWPVVSNFFLENGTSDLNAVCCVVYLCSVPVRPASLKNVSGELELG